jgi:hypothetical protein
MHWATPTKTCDWTSYLSRSNPTSRVLTSSNESVWKMTESESARARDGASESHPRPPTWSDKPGLVQDRRVPTVSVLDILRTSAPSLEVRWKAVPSKTQRPLSGLLLSDPRGRAIPPSSLSSDSLRQLNVTSFSSSNHDQLMVWLTPPGSNADHCPHPMFATPHTNNDMALCVLTDFALATTLVIVHQTLASTIIVLSVITALRDSC